MTTAPLINGRHPCDINEMTFAEALSVLSGAHLASPEGLGVISLPLADLATLEVVFQHRNDSAQEYDRERHVKSLAKTLNGLPERDRQLEPVLALCLDGVWVCVDGHHRLKAYAKVGVEAIDVQPFVGTVNEAIAAAAAGNSKDKLSLSNRERQEAAWKFTALFHGSKAEVSRWAGVSTSQVGKMRRMRDELLDSNRYFPIDNYLKARDIWEGRQTVRGEEWEDKQVALFEKRLSKSFGKHLHKNRSLFATALGNFSPSVIEAIIEAYALEHREQIEAMFEEDDDSDF